MRDSPCPGILLPTVAQPNIYATGVSLLIKQTKKLPYLLHYNDKEKSFGSEEGQLNKCHSWSVLRNEIGSETLGDYRLAAGGVAALVNE